MPSGFKIPKAASTQWDSLILGAAILFCFGPLLWAPFMFDDLPYVLHNRFVVGPWPGLWALLTQPVDASGAYEPLVTLEHRLLYLVFGPVAWPYRLSSLALHWANAVLFLSFVKRRVDNRWAALAAALLFALHPAQVQTLALSTYKTHLTSAFFALLILNIVDRPGWDSPLGLGGLWALFALALFAKETSFVIILLAARNIGLRRGMTLAKIPAAFWMLDIGWVLVLAAYFFFRAAAVPRGISLGAPLVPALLSSAKSFLWYLSQILVPCNLALEHDLHRIWNPLSVEAFLIGGGAIAALVALFAATRREKNSQFAVFWIIVCLAMFIGLVPVTYGLVADRYLYLAVAGAALLAALKVPRRGIPVLFALAAIYGALDLREAAAYSNPIEVWTRAAEYAPESPRAHAVLGALLYDRGRFAQAQAELGAALTLKPDYQPALEDMAATQAVLGHCDEAVVLARRAVALKDDPPAELTLRSVLGRCSER